MNRVKYLLIFCIVVLLTGASIRTLQERYREDFPKQARVFVPVSSVEPYADIDKSILIDDQENPIVIPKKVEEIKPVIKPYISAESYIVANLETDEVYIDFNSNKVFPIASVSKLYTALVVHHLFDMEKMITVTQSMLDAYGEAGDLRLDEKFTPNEMLHFLLMVSSNDSAEAFSQSFGVSTSSEEFISEMNSFASEIGMNNTLFKDPSGLNPANVSTAKDLLTLSRYLYKSEKDILEISKTKEIDIATTTDHGYHRLVNINPFSYYKGFLGGKTGRTNFAKEAMVTLVNQEVGDKKYPIAIIILRSELGQREIDTEKLLDMFINKVGGV